MPAPEAAEDKIAERLAEARSDADKAYAAFHAYPPRQVDMDWSAGVLLGHLTTFIAAAEEMVKAHRPVQLYQRQDDCGHLEPDDDASGEWADWDAEHPSGEDLVSGADDYRICLALPLGEPACPGCTEIVQQATGDDTGDPVPVSECLVRPLIARHLTGEEKP